MTKIYNLPASYIRKNQFTAFLQKQMNQILICWYIGPSSGRLIGIYLDTLENESLLCAFNQKNGKLECKERGINWQFFEEHFRKSPEVYCTKYMAFFLGLQEFPPKKERCKIIQFPVPTAKPKRKKSKKVETA